MSLRQEDRHLLLWYVSGRLGMRERREFDRHLEECEECRDEVAALSSMMRSVRSQARLDHVTAEALARYEEDTAVLPADLDASIEAHLAECAECQEDLAALRRARQLEAAPALPQTAPGKPLAVRRRWMLGAAAAAALMAIAIVPGLMRQPAGDTRPTVVRSAVFAPPRRGAEAARRLAGTGPWAIRVLLPFGAEEGTYRATILRDGAGPVPQFVSLAGTDGEQSLTVILPDLPGPGRYTMSLRRDPAGPGAPYLYPFELLPESGRKAAD